MTRVWNPPDTNDLIRRYRAGEGSVRLGRLYGVSPKAIRNALSDLGVPISKQHAQRVTGADADLVRRYTAGESVLALSNDLGMSRTAITLRLERASVVIRGSADQGPNPYASRCRSALTEEMNQSSIGKHETALTNWLRDTGYEVIQQRAVGPYNIDVAVLPVAVEVLGSDWNLNPAKRGMRRERIEYLLGRGWGVLEILIPARATLQSGGIEQIIAFIQAIRSNPPTPRQYRVIRGNGNDATARCGCLD